MGAWHPLFNLNGCPGTRGIRSNDAPVKVIKKQMYLLYVIAKITFILEQVPRVPGHPLRLDNGCQAPILRTILNLKIYQFRENDEKWVGFSEFSQFCTRPTQTLTTSLQQFIYVRP